MGHADEQRFRLPATHPAEGLTRVDTELQRDPPPQIDFLPAKPSGTAEPSNLALLRRTLSFAKPYLAPIGLSIALTLVFSAGRYGRAYLMQPLLDNVLLPAHATLVFDPSILAEL
jgi:hypothetical protein